MLNFAGIVDNSTVDYPGHITAVIYLCGCDFRCPFCHNREVVLSQEPTCKKTEVDEIVGRIKENYLIEAVTVTGGEPLLQPESLELIKKLKGLGIKIKLDTNASFSENLANIIDSVDFIAIDVKAPFEKYGLAIGVSDNNKIMQDVEKSFSILKNDKTPKEARTTIVPGINDSEEDIIKMAKIVSDVGFNIYTIQQFRPANTLDPKYESVESPGANKMRALAKLAKEHLPEVRVRVVTIEHGFEDIE